MINFRLATHDDLNLYFEWVNDLETRMNAFQSNPISLSEHTNWFNNALKNKNIILLIFSRDGENIGQGRINIEGEKGIIDFSVAPNKRRLGYGTKILNLLLDFSKKNTEIKILLGCVKKNNIASMKAFERSNFALKKDDNDYYTFEKKIM